MVSTRRSTKHHEQSLNDFVIVGVTSWVVSFQIKRNRELGPGFVKGLGPILKFSALPLRSRRLCGECI